jgi:tetratricopeptide (TPR) repeat protein
MDPRELLLRAAQTIGLIDTDKAKAMPTGVDETLAELSRLGVTDVDRIKNSVRAAHDKMKQGQITADGAITQIVEQWPIGPTVKLDDSRPALPAPVVRGEDIAKRYTLTKEIGRGGMGEVYKAYDEQLRRFVAIKFLLGGDAEDVGRFRNEAFIAAKLSHPNIAQVYEVGEHKGRPFIVMQFVDGETLARKKLDLREALQVVKTVAEAIEQAHRHNIIHRDLKPGNLMMEADGRVFVMDFGLAKHTKSSILTTQGTILGTPAYMAPEQARGEAATPLSDVYALGATLYDLLAGRPPFVGRAPLDVIKQIESSDPAPLRRLQPAIPEEVETIVLRAMEKEPSRRYGSAAELAADLGRYVSGEPIHARPHGALYRWRKKIARHRLVSALLALLVVGTLVAAAVSYAGTVKRRNVQARLDAARTQITEAMLMKYRARGDVAKIRALADRGLGKIDDAERIGGVTAETLVERARAYRVQDELEKADQCFQAALERDPRQHDTRVERLMLLFARLRRHSGMTLVTQASMSTHVSVEDRQAIAELVRQTRAEIPSVDLQKIERWKASLVEALSAFIAGDNATSTRHIDACLKAYEHSPDAYVLRGYLHMGRGEFAEAGRSFDSAIAYRSTDPSLWNLLAICEMRSGRVDDAIESLNASIDIWPDQWRAPISLSAAYTLKGEPQKAADVCSDILQRLPNLAIAYNNRAVAAIEMKRYSAAEEDLRVALKLEPQFFDARVTRAILNVHRKKLAEAVEDFEAAYALDARNLEAELARIVLNATEPAQIEVLSDLLTRRYPNNPNGPWRRGSVHYGRGEYQKALEYYGIALRLRPDDAALLCDHANALLSLGKPAEAEEEYSRALELSEPLAGAYIGRAQARLQLNDLDGAEKDFERAAARDSKNATVYFAWGNFAYSIQDYNRAEERFRQALALNPDFADAWSNLGNTHFARQDMAKAIEAYGQAIRSKPDGARYYFNRGTAYWRLNQRSQAQADFKTCVGLDPAFKDLIPKDDSR